MQKQLAADDGGPQSSFSPGDSTRGRVGRAVVRGNGHQDYTRTAPHLNILALD